MKKKILFVLFIFVMQIACAQIPELSIWQNIRNSSYTIDDSIHIRSEILPLPGFENGLYYLYENNWHYTEMRVLNDSLTNEAIIPINPAETQIGRFKTEHDSLVFLMPIHLTEDNFPPELNDLSLVGESPTQDTIATNLDITAEYFGYSDQKFYAVIKNNGGGFPTIGIGWPLEMYIYTAVIANPENVLLDSVAYALVFVNFLTFTPGIYKVTPDSLTLASFERIGDIEYEISDSLLFMRCNITDITEDEDFGDWPNLSNTLAFGTGTIGVSIDLAIQGGDIGKPSFLNFAPCEIEPFVNILPQIYDVNYLILGNFTEIDLSYFDENEHFPIISELVVDNNNIYQMFPLSFDYSSTVPFIASIPEIGWDEILIRFSDNGFDFVEYTIYNVNADNYELQSAITEAKLSNSPNPFNPETTIKFTAENAENAEIIIFNIKGQKVKTLINEKKDSGNYQVVWDGTDNSKKQVSSGIYFYKLTSGKKTLNKKMLLLK
ncbi:MAG: T9SS type A sorting domain-containing protein [Armatimonadetes bacterium]|nr:T9SS type A sorting domain-containing protein [Armatimonadota bacterium]